MGILHLFNTHSIPFKVELGRDTNNFCELMALKLVLMLAQENEISQIQIYGDSQLVIQWIKGEFNLHNFTLQHLFHDILLLKSTFSLFHACFGHELRSRRAI
jgi:ribonuclease HI